MLKFKTWSPKLEVLDACSGLPEVIVLNVRGPFLNVGGPKTRGEIGGYALRGGTSPKNTIKTYIFFITVA